MWTVTKIRADYEGWLLFSDWPENIVEKYQYQDFDDMFKHYQQLINKCKVQFDNYVTGKYNIYAFYNNCDMN
ncbi:regulatory protein MsaA, partial [Staphylococcus aureus]